MAFIDTQLYIHQMYSIKNFILAADVMKSISLLRYQEESKTLSLVSRVPQSRTPPPDPESKSLIYRLAVVEEPGQN